MEMVTDEDINNLFPHLDEVERASVVEFLFGPPREYQWSPEEDYETEDECSKCIEGKKASQMLNALASKLPPKVKIRLLVQNPSKGALSIPRT